jgi:ABC-type nickel/cobalt efflux system permease component RcnA
MSMPAGLEFMLNHPTLTVMIQLASFLFVVAFCVFVCWKLLQIESHLRSDNKKLHSKKQESKTFEVSKPTTFDDKYRAETPQGKGTPDQDGHQAVSKPQSAPDADLKYRPKS